MGIILILPESTSYYIPAHAVFESWGRNSFLSSTFPAGILYFAIPVNILGVLFN